jgi:hypothetical protein
MVGVFIGLLWPTPLRVYASDSAPLHYFIASSISQFPATPQATTSSPPESQSAPATSSTTAPDQKQTQCGAAKPVAKTRRRKKTSSSDCPPSAPAASAGTNPTPQNPCPPPKKIVRNGGSDEPAIQLTGGASGEQAVHQRPTEQLTAATEGNLKALAGRSLTSSQQDTVSQIKQFMEQSKTAAAAGDLDLAHSLALKAHLLSDELVNPQ